MFYFNSFLTREKKFDILLSGQMVEALLQFLIYTLLVQIANVLTPISIINMLITFKIISLN
ncbi:MAG: hypothetical protein A2275_04900 [Bacteroidetes bacterium RIFOXYA12_FULL_35_11]|nr:MAG: hypothetical protein A2275_04900 [Bacteroidetes bacterium RIFOXYA12_FULL_35_11]HBX49431.1 hypothetical protein [Bacteroidales bacterium]